MLNLPLILGLTLALLGRFTFQNNLPERVDQRFMQPLFRRADAELERRFLVAAF